MISLQNIDKNFGIHRALKGVDLDVNRGDFVVLFGDNGAGKSTLLRIMSGLMAPTSGKITINGKPFSGTDGGMRREIGVVGHKACVYPSLSARTNLLFFGKLFGVPDLPRRTEEVLSRVGLSYMIKISSHSRQ